MTIQPGMAHSYWWVDVFEPCSKPKFAGIKRASVWVMVVVVGVVVEEVVDVVVQVVYVRVEVVSVVVDVVVV